MQVKENIVVIDLDKENCSICLENLTENDKVRPNCCRHDFHFDCLYVWSQKALTTAECPNCKAKYDHLIRKTKDDVLLKIYTN